MLDIGSQLVAKWARYGPENKINVTNDFTRLTLDSIALYVPCNTLVIMRSSCCRCALDTRFNSFYREDMHPFVDAMQVLLSCPSLKCYSASADR